MEVRIKKRITILVLVIVSVTVLIIIIRPFIFNHLKNRLQKNIHALNKTGLNIKYDSIGIDWKKSLILIDGLVLEKDAYDTTCIYPEFISAAQIRLEGFSLVQFIFKKKLAFGSIRIYRPHFVIRKHSHLLSGRASQQGEELTITVEDLYLSAAHLEYTDSALCKLLVEIKSTIRVSGLALDFQANEPLGIFTTAVQLDSTEINLPKAFYTLLIKETNVNFSKGIAHVDTIRIIPHLTKLGFGRTTGHETDRVEGVIPFINLYGFSFPSPDTVDLDVTNADIQMFIKVFRDKRLPDKKRYTLLPVPHLRRLPFGVRIDTFRIIKSYVEYEEFAEEAESSSTLFFDNLAATIYTINNDSTITDGQTIMDAQASFMGKGDLKVHSTFPWNPESHCQMEGSLRNFPIPEINTVLEPATDIKVESGMLQKLSFHFAYNDQRSSGEIELNYQDLKLISFKNEEKSAKAARRKNRKKNKNADNHESDNEVKKDNLKSFILNSFVIRKNMDENVPEEKRTGKVQFERNTSRSILNYWWKSLFSGIKSASNLNKMENKKSGKNERKKN